MLPRGFLRTTALQSTKQYDSEDSNGVDCAYVVKFYDTIRMFGFAPLNFYVVHIADIVEFTFCNHIRGWTTFTIFSGALDCNRRLATLHCITITCIHKKCVFSGWLQISPQISRIFTDGLIHHRLKQKKVRLSKRWLFSSENRYYC